MLVIAAVWGALTGAMGAFIVGRFAEELGLVDHPNQRSSHSRPTPKGGGVGLALGFIGLAWYLEVPISFWLPPVLLACLGLIDDRLELSARLRLLIQFGLASWVVVAWMVPSLPEAILPVVFWILFLVATANFFNFMDGINGIAGITGGVAFGLCGAFAALQGDAVAGILCLTVAVGCAGFLPFNIPRATVFLGDVGSIFMGFLFAMMVFRLSHTVANFLCLSSFLAPFFVDTLLTLWVRWRDGDRLMDAHRRHAYQILANQASLAHWQVSMGYGGLQLCAGLIMLMVHSQGSATAVYLVSLPLLLFFVFLYQRIRCQETREC